MAHVHGGRHHHPCESLCLWLFLVSQGRCCSQVPWILSGEDNADRALSKCCTSLPLRRLLGLCRWCCGPHPYGCLATVFGDGGGYEFHGCGCHRRGQCCAATPSSIQRNTLGKSLLVFCLYCQPHCSVTLLVDLCLFYLSPCKLIC